MKLAWIVSSIIVEYREIQNPPPPPKKKKKKKGGGGNLIAVSHWEDIISKYIQVIEFEWQRKHEMPGYKLSRM